MEEQKGRTIRMDMDEEIKAIVDGQCALCRIGATHIRNEDCINTPDGRFLMLDCYKCKHRYCKEWFDKCPMCIKKGEK